MPLTRYQVRNEYGLADPELYRAADRDDPEALLEGVAMAGLVGVLRQLGDLAEFAAEIFHDLHEEVLATASRGHSLMVRVQQLEVEFPLVEKALLSQTNHTSFFSNPGVDWHANMRTQQNLIARGDLPRFVMDSYEECRGPPRLFLLDKFDVAGAGACLKRYTDPSFFREEASTDDVQRERKVRRVKKKGMRGRNGGTPEVLPASHAKLQQLFMEESIANSYSNPARLVKLKRRQFNEPPFCSRNGKSYMEKFVETPPPESKTVHEVSIAPSSLRWTRDCESGNEIIDVNMVSPEKNLSKEKGSKLTSIKEALLPERSFECLDGMLVNGKETEEPEPPHDYETYGSPTLYETEKRELVDAEAKMDRGMNVCHSDEIASEVENYVDALATMESEAETDNECGAKDDKHFLNDEKDETDSDTNEEHLEFQAQYSDSQSLGYSASEDGNTSLIKGSSSFDSQSNLVDNIASDGEGIARAFPSTETSAFHHVNMTYNQLPAYEATREIEDSHESAVPKHVGTEDEEISDLGEASIDLCSTGMNAKLSPSAHVESLKVESGAVESGAEGSDKKELEVDRFRAVFSDSASQNQDGALSSIASESNPIFQSVDADPIVSSDVLMHSLTVLELAREHESKITYEDAELNDEHEGADHSAQRQSLQVESEAEGSDQEESEIDKIRTVFSDTAPQNQDGALSPIGSESNSIIQSVDADVKVSSDVLMHSSTVLELPHEHERNITYKHEEWDDEYEGADHIGHVRSAKITSWHLNTTFPEDQFQFSVMPEASRYSDLQTLSESSVSYPAYNPDMANLHVTNSEVHPLAVGLVNSENPIVIEDTQQTHIVKQQSFDFTYDAPLHEQNALEVDVQPLQENVELGKNETCKDFDDVVKVSSTTEAVKGYASLLNFPCNSSILNENTSLHDMGTERAPIEQLLLPTAVIDPNDHNATTNLDPTADTVGNSCADPQDPLPDIDNLPQIESNLDEEASPECNKESNLLEEARDPKAPYAENNSIPSDLTSHPKSAVECEMPGSSFVEKLLGRHPSDDGTMGSGYAELGTDELEPKPSSQGHLPCSSEDTLSSLHIYHQVDQEDIPEHLLDVPPHELDLNLSCKDEVSHWTFNPQSETLRSADHMVQENILSRRPGSPLECPSEYQNDIFDAECLQGDETRNQSSVLSSGELQSSDSLGMEKYAAFESYPEDKTTQRSFSESLPKSASKEVDSISAVGASLHTNIATSSQGSGMAEIILEDAPNLAPLPPYEWMMGKDHHVPLASQGEVFQIGQDSLHLLQHLPAEQNPQLQLSASGGGVTFPNDTLLNLENEKLHPEEREDEVAPSPLSSLTHVLDGNSVIQDNISVMEVTEILDHFSTCVSEHAFLDLGRGLVQSSLSSLPTHPFVEDGPSGNGPVSSQGKVTQHIESASSALKNNVQQNFYEKSEAQHDSSLNASDPSELKQDEHLQNDLHNLDGERALEATSALPENELVQPNGKSMSNISRPPKRLIEAVAAHDSSLNASDPSELKQDEHLQNDLHNLDGERALEATSALPENELVQPNGKAMSNIPRPPKRLIEAVAAHDRSMLRKVTERVKPPIEPTGNERDSLLEQIRTKSFNLKPAVVTRPSIQGPKTNLKVNAILEKANAIRQAFAGSDEDDDEDSWSDT